MEHWTGTPKRTSNVLRTLREVDAISAMESSTTQDTRTNAQDWNTGLIWRKGLGTSRAKSFTVRRIWDVGIANNVERFLYRTFGNGFPALLTLYIRKWTSVLWVRVQLHRMWGRVFRAESLDWYGAERSKKRVHSVNPFCFVIYGHYSLINHCEERYS